MNYVEQILKRQIVEVLSQDQQMEKELISFSWRNAAVKAHI